MPKFTNTYLLKLINFSNIFKKIRWGRTLLGGDKANLGEEDMYPPNRPKQRPCLHGFMNRKLIQFLMKIIM